MDNKTKILGIAPYEGMKALMLRSAQNRNDIEITVYVGDLEAGAEIASKHSLEDFDVILSRGGTAELISSVSTIPVVEIQLSAYDILRTIKLVENYNEHYAIIGYASITKSARFLCDLLQYDIDIYTVHNPNEVNSVLSQLSKDGCSLVLCDVISHSQAQQLGIRSILFTSGTESIDAAFDHAVKTKETYQALLSKSNFFQTLLEEHSCHIFVYNEKADMIYTSKNHEFSASVMNAMKNYVPDILEEEHKKFYKDEGNIMVSVNGMKKIIYKQVFVVYYINTRKLPLSLIKNGISYMDQKQAMNQFYSSFYGIISPSGAFEKSPWQGSQSNVPVMILGERGTGLDETAAFLYAQSSFKNRPMAVIDFSHINEKNWGFLTEHMNSPLGDTYTAIYFKNIGLLSDGHFHELLSVMRDLNLTRRNRAIFSYIIQEEGNLPERCRILMDCFTCLPYYIRPLREHSDEIQNLASLYVNSLNMQMAKEIIGLEPEASVLLEHYSWPGNYDQFQRIMTELFSVTETPYIKAASVSRLLMKETPSLLTAGEQQQLNLNRPLNEINLDIALYVLAQKGGNQSAAAKQLGISRTTLWRMLQNVL